MVHALRTTVGHCLNSTLVVYDTILIDHFFELSRRYEILGRCATTTVADGNLVFHGFLKVNLAVDTCQTLEMSPSPPLLSTAEVYGSTHNNSAILGFTVNHQRSG